MHTNSENLGLRQGLSFSVEPGIEPWLSEYWASAPSLNQPQRLGGASFSSTPNSCGLAPGCPTGMPSTRKKKEHLEEMLLFCTHNFKPTKRDCPGEKRSNVAPCLMPQVYVTAHAEPWSPRHCPGDRRLHLRPQLHILAMLREHHFGDEVSHVPGLSS